MPEFQIFIVTSYHECITASNLHPTWNERRELTEFSHKTNESCVAACHVTCFLGHKHSMTAIIEGWSKQQMAKAVKQTLVAHECTICQNNENTRHCARMSLLSIMRGSAMSNHNVPYNAIIMCSLYPNPNNEFFNNQQIPAKPEVLTVQYVLNLGAVWLATLDKKGNYSIY